MANTQVKSKRGKIVKAMLLRLDQPQATKLRLYSESLSLPIATIVRRAISDLPQPPVFAVRKPLPAICDAAMVSALRQIGSFISKKIKDRELTEKDCGQIRDTILKMAADLTKRMA